MNNFKEIKQRIILGIVLFLLGMLGILSMLSMEIPIPQEIEIVLKEQFTSEQIKLLLLINPTIILLISVVIGTILYQKVNLRIPLLERILKISSSPIELFKIVQYGVFGGVISGLFISIISISYSKFLPIEFLKLEEGIKTNIAVKLLYGGFTEEIMLRFGLMTFIVWLSSKIFGNSKPTTYWVGIIISAILFAIGHFPIVFQTVETPSLPLLSYIIIGNSIGGVIFGWLYWKKGLEAAFIAHIFAHLTMIFIQSIF